MHLEEITILYCALGNSHEDVTTKDLVERTLDVGKVTDGPLDR